MAAPATSKHLQREQLNSPNIIHELREFSAWLSVEGRAFQDINPGCSKCIDIGKTEAIIPLLKELGFDDKDPKFRFNVFRLKGNSPFPFNPGLGRGAYLIPIRQEVDAIGSPNTSNNPNPSEEELTELVVGERVYFDHRIFIQSSFYVVVVTTID